MADLLHVPSTQVEWLPPPAGTVKLNFDGGLSRHRRCGVAAGIFRDHRGVPLFSYACANPSLVGVTSYDAEAKALALGLDFAHALGFTSLWVEGDAKFLIDVVRSKRPNSWYDEGVIGHVRGALLTQFPLQEPMLTHIHREGNAAADALVRYMRNDVDSLDGSEWWGRDHKLPSKVAAIVDRERDGYVYVRRGCSFPRPQSCYVPTASLV